MEDIQSDEEAPVEAEVRDLCSCIQAMASTVKEIETRFESLKNDMGFISELLQQQENLEMEAEDETHHAASDATTDQLLTTEKLSQTAKTLLDQVGRWPNRFKEFLLEDSFGKPKPQVLPIVRGYATSSSAEEIPKIVEDLKAFNNCLNQARDYIREERRKDANLQKRIVRLVDNIERELAQEEREGMKQTSMESYTIRK